MKMTIALIGLVSALGLVPATVLAQEEVPAPYFIAYSDYMEEPGTLEIGTSFVRGRANGINRFLGDWTEFEFGIRKWWTTEFYVDWQHTHDEGGLFTGVRFENRFRPWLEDHRINPVLYVEYEHVTGADKTLKEIVGFDSKEDLTATNAEARLEHERELETKLILSSDIGAWNVSENFIAVRSLNEGGWEFGYVVGVSRPLATTGRRCAFCAASFAAGVELYGGLGTSTNFTVSGTSQYLAPVVAWALPNEMTIRVSPGWGLTDQSVGTLFRISVSQEIGGLGTRLKNLFSH